MKRMQGGGGTDGHSGDFLNGLTLGSHLTKGLEPKFIDRRVIVET